VEMPFSRWTDRMLEDVIELNERPDTQVVMAHIERYIAMQPPGTVEKLISRGVKIQSNVSFFTNWQTRYRAMTMLKNEQIHILGSDCHNMKTRRPNWDQLPEKAWELANQSSMCDVFRPKEF